MGDDLHEILQNSSIEEYTQNKPSEGNKVEIDKEADVAEERAIQGEDVERKKQEFATASCTINQTFSRKSGVQWR